jgi:hypothetical protein
MEPLSTQAHSIEVIPTDYALAYASLARRVAAAYAYQSKADYESAEAELEAALHVINLVENPPFSIKNVST